MGTRCISPIRDDEPPDLEAQAIYRRSAHNLAWVVKDFPYNADEAGFARRSDHTATSVQAYQRAFNCDPTWDNRTLLEDALELLDLRLGLAVDSEKRSIDAEDLDPLQMARGQLSEQLDALRAPACPTSATTQCTEPQPAKLAGDRGPDTRSLRILESFSLGLELAAGIVVPSVTPLGAGAVSPAARFVLGKAGQHRIHLGFLYGVHRSRGVMVSTLLAQFDYGVSDKSGWLTMHASIGAGYHEVYPEVRAAPELASVISPGLGVCTLDDVLCLRARGFLGPLDRDYLTIGLSLDPIRLAARRARTKNTTNKKP